jgi:hypothetical protein
VDDELHTAALVTLSTACVSSTNQALIEVVQAIAPRPPGGHHRPRRFHAADITRRR